MLRQCRSLFVAEMVVAAIINDNRTAEIEGIIQSYQNGREQGFSITMLKVQNKFIKAIVDHTYHICEARNMAKIVVYIGYFANQGLSEDAYKNSVEFNWGCYADAANWIIDDMFAFCNKNLSEQE